MMSGLGGAIFWPPPGLKETYATISWITTLDGIEGPIARSVMGAGCLWLWLFSDRAAHRKAAQILSLVVILALIVNFAVAYHGLGAFGWLAIGAFGVADVVRGELVRIELGKAKLMAARASRTDRTTHEDGHAA